MNKFISGFSKLSKLEKIKWIANTYFSTPEEVEALLTTYWNADEKLQLLHDEFVENTITNFYLPLGVAPNFLINDTVYTIPMAIEESSVVAAAAKSAKYWSDRGGFKTSIIGTEKIGQVHFLFSGSSQKLQQFIQSIKPLFYSNTDHFTINMQKRGGGILDIILKDKTDLVPNYYQLHATFETKDSMGANFINTCLEEFSKTLLSQAELCTDFSEDEKNIQVIMSILSNYVPNCLVRAEVSCKVEDLADSTIKNPQEFAEKFVRAIQIAEVEPYRAVTHNKGIMNGVDSVILATGNDFRAIEAGVHAYASRSGKYSSLSHAKVENGIFTMWLEIPLALGTVGGLTSLHPLVKFSLEMLKKPSAQQLMQIVAATGLAQNFAAIKSLTTTGIQAGHMKMHLNNILNQLEASDDERTEVRNHFKSNTVTHAAVVELIKKTRNTI
ncbi:hydroxymethylglutaryl-CoA reductase, degradative [Flavobacterium ardleyense]|uniref:hydroxymethylglutaryl-CoA reductase, degradative n=1 Tax=Flavobacterium ardleyense TaxID=2038737 RepID=UPI00298C3873|nr:hydroxymethylglutaryl-CoA reductase, degradative [Flavobacterium ardleyense]